MKWIGHVARMGEMRNALNFSRETWREETTRKNES